MKNNTHILFHFSGQVHGDIGATIPPLCKKPPHSSGTNPVTCKGQLSCAYGGNCPTMISGAPRDFGHTLA